eukprot:584247-Rhodomonas_salina.2
MSPCPVSPTSRPVGPRSRPRTCYKPTETSQNRVRSRWESAPSGLGSRRVALWPRHAVGPRCDVTARGCAPESPSDFGPCVGELAALRQSRRTAPPGSSIAVVSTRLRLGQY